MLTLLLHVCLRLVASVSAAGVATAVSAAVLTPTPTNAPDAPVEPPVTTSSIPIVPTSDRYPVILHNDPLPIETPTAKPTYDPPKTVTPTLTASAVPTHSVSATPTPTPTHTRKPKPVHTHKPKPSKPKVVHYATSSGTAKGYAASKVNSSNFDCLVKLWNRESGWNTHAENSSSGAYGIPQSLPGSKMSAFGSDWRDNYRTQIDWGLNYIEARYGSACGAWAHSEDLGWY